VGNERRCSTVKNFQFPRVCVFCLNKIFILKNAYESICFIVFSILPSRRNDHNNNNIVSGQTKEEWNGKYCHRISGCKHRVCVYTAKTVYFHRKNRVKNSLFQTSIIIIIIIIIHDGGYFVKNLNFVCFQ